MFHSLNNTLIWTNSEIHIPISRREIMASLVICSVIGTMNIITAFFFATTDKIFVNKYNTLVYSVTICGFLCMVSYVLYCGITIYNFQSDLLVNICGISVFLIYIFGLCTEFHVVLIAVSRYIATYSSVNTILNTITSWKILIATYVIIPTYTSIVFYRSGEISAYECNTKYTLGKQTTNLIGISAAVIEIFSVLFSILTIKRLIHNKIQVLPTSTTNVNTSVIKLRKNVLILGVTITFLIISISPRILQAVGIESAYRVSFQLFILRPTINPFLYIFTNREFINRIRNLCKSWRCCEYNILLKFILFVFNI